MIEIEYDSDELYSPKVFVICNMCTTHSYTDILLQRTDVLVLLGCKHNSQVNKNIYKVLTKYGILELYLPVRASITDYLDSFDQFAPAIR